MKMMLISNIMIKIINKIKVINLKKLIMYKKKNNKKKINLLKFNKNKPYNKM
jgi:hypothetical protein